MGNRRTVLHRFSAKQNNAYINNMVQFLLEHGIDINLRNNQGQTAADIAMQEALALIQSYRKKNIDRAMNALATSDRGPESQPKDRPFLQAKQDRIIKLNSELVDVVGSYL